MSKVRSRPFKYTARFHDENPSNVQSLTDIYNVGLFVGHFLRRNIHDDQIIKALRSGNDVYFLARDMTVIQQFLKDQYPNAKVVYGANRKSYEDTRTAYIKEQVKLDHKGLVLDSGFAGSCVKPVIALSAKRKSDKVNLTRNLDRDHNKRLQRFIDDKYKDKLLKGLLFSGTHDSYFPALQDHHKSRSHRSCIIDLEHSPKTEISESDCTYSSLDKTLWKRERAFRLGLHSGFMNLNSKGLVAPIQREAHKARLQARVDQARKDKYELRNTFRRLDDFAKYGAIWYIGNGKLERYPNKMLTDKAYFNGKLRKVVFKSALVAKRALEIYNATNDSEFLRFERRVYEVRASLKRFEMMRLEAEKNYQYALKRIEESEAQYTAKLLKPFRKLTDQQRAINYLLGSDIC